jgi:heterotetrameric sarcosine oxidase delta subunit
VIEVHCPNCGRRNVAEFRYAGERHARPDPNAADAATWRSYLYARDNPAGWVDETWLHRSGCRRYLAVERHTVTNEIRAVREAADGGAGSGPRSDRPLELGHRGDQQDGGPGSPDAGAST